MKIDLHTHSAFSDGTLEPDELVDLAGRLDISHLSLCDHDSTEGIHQAAPRAKELGITLIPGVEINTRETEEIVSSIHILGYFIDEKNEKLQKMLTHCRQVRSKRAEAMIERFKRMGIKLSLSDFSDRKGRAAIGRPHLADKLKEMGIVFSRQEAFDKYLARGKSAYVYYEGPNVRETIEMILECKGIPVLAHPGYSVHNGLIDSIIQMGIQGIEVYYPSHTPDHVRHYMEIARKNNLIVTGGSDYHGPGSGHESIGEVNVPFSCIEELLERKQKLFG